MPEGFDAATNCAHVVGKIVAAHLDFVIRYYSHTPAKNLTRGEAIAFSDAGLNVVVVWESKGGPGSFFSRSQGVADGTTAYQQALQIGQPPQTPIYFAVDFDADSVEVAGGINDYFRGVVAGFDAISHGTPAYSVGVYGSGLVCSWLQQHALVTHTWLAGATGWRGSKTYQNWNIKQGRAGDPWGFGFDIDPDEAKMDYGGFQVLAH
jgi:hypothetical protein